MNTLPIGVDNHVIDGVIVEIDSRAPQSKHFRLKSYILSVLVLVIVIASTVISYVRGRNKLISQPVSNETLFTNQTNSTFLSETLKEILIPISGEAKLRDPTSSQHYAWALVSGFENLIIENPEKIDLVLQSYILILVADTISAGALDSFWEVSFYQLGAECNLFMCNSDGKVTSFFLINKVTTIGGGGSIPSEIAYMSELEMIVISRNGLVGTIPTELGLLKHLHTLDVSGNSLTGTIPSELGQMERLRYIYFGQNNLSGTIPSQISNIPIEYVDLSENILHGIVPFSFNITPNLFGFDIHNNDLHGNLEFMCNREYLNTTFVHETAKKSFLKISYIYEGFMGILIDFDSEDKVIQCGCCTCA